MTAPLPNPQPHVIATDFEGGEGVLIDINAKRYYQLNETAMLVWRGLETGKQLPEILAEMMADYEVSAEQATMSITRLLRDLYALRLVEPDSALVPAARSIRK